MKSIIIGLQRSFLIAGVIVLSGGLMPVITFADDSPAPQTCVPVGSDLPGVHKPVGSDASMFTYNCATNLWESDHFSYDPLTGLTSPKDPSIFAYNSTSGLYDSTYWVFDAPTHTYVPYVQSLTVPPAGSTVVGGPVAPSIGTGSSGINNTGPGSNNTIDTAGGAINGNISNTGPDSNNTIGGSLHGDLNVNDLTNATVNNVINGLAVTGNSGVLGNTSGGNATTGNAQDIANVVNMLQSTSNALGGNTITFVANINGDVNGDLLLDPSTLGNIQPATAAAQNNLNLNNQTNATINNDITVGATSGNATIANNTSAGNATTGNADAIANVVNMLNSAINAGKSFLGVVNINGNLNGDILLPPNFIDQLIAANVPTVSISTTGPSSNNSITNGGSGNTSTVTNTNNLGATNTIHSTAASGTASVTNNTAGGNATSGNANTSTITAFNLTGSTVVGGNDLLVFVNVSGKWVGMIVNAPAGATAAELGSGISTNSISGNTNANVNNTTNDRINNNINVAAQTGNAAVTGNTKGGNATSGNARTAVNLLNVENSQLTFANWFGILFINVFGTWNGSFGVNTSAGDPIASPSSSNGGSTNSETVPVAARVFAFVPHGVVNSGPGSTNSITTDAVLAAHIVKTRAISLAPHPQLQSGAHRNFWLPLAGVTLFALYMVGERLYTIRSNRQM